MVEPHTPPKLNNKEHLNEKVSLNNPIIKEKASGKKYSKRGLKVTKKVSPKSDKKKPELKLLFEKIRQKKERDAERKKNLNSIKDDDKETSERKKVLVRKEESIESVSDILKGGTELYQN